MNYYRRPENLLESLLRWRRNVFLQSPGGGYVLVSATRYLLTLHHFSGSLRHEPTHTEFLDPIPGLFDGNGWNWASLRSIESIFPQNHQIQSEEYKVTENQQPFTAFYCKPTRDSIRKMSDVEMKVFVALATYTDDQLICFPSVRKLAEDTGKQPGEVSEALQGLQGKGLLHYVRKNGIDPITRKVQPDVMALSGSILRAKTDSGFQAYMFEFLSPNLRENHVQPESPESNTRIQNQEPTPVTTTTNQLQNARAREMQKTLESGIAGKAPDYANQPAAQPQPKEPENDVPPLDTGRLDSFTTPLPQIDKEAYAQEMRHLVSGLQLAKARQLVEVYGIEMCGVAVRLLAKQPFKSVDNPPGWIINKLRQGALVPEDGKDRYDDYIGH